jgi:putative photosynthetic complex assembly protein 2
MTAFASPILATLLLWWASTGLILYLDGLNRRTFVWSMAGASVLLALSVWGIIASAGNVSAGGAYVAFACGLTAWGWQLVSFYMGYVTGPRKTACEPELTGWPRFVEAVRTSLHHELMVILTAVIIAALTWGQPNQMALWTFVALWWMHTSAKLNLFFGAANLGEELLPEHLRYLKTFMSQRPMNLLFPVSVTLSTIIAVLLAQKALALTATRFETAGFTMLATLMALAVAEHWFLVIPLHVNGLWQFGVKPIAEDSAPVAASASEEPSVPAVSDSDYALPAAEAVALENPMRRPSVRPRAVV